MVNVDLNKMCDWERKKAVFLLNVAESLGMDTSGYGDLAVNSNSGYTYLWLEDYCFTLYMPINCELVKSDVWALWTNSEDDEEIEINLKEDTTLQDLEEWADNLNKEAEKKAEND